MWVGETTRPPNENHMFLEATGAVLEATGAVLGATGAVLEATGAVLEATGLCHRGCSGAQGLFWSPLEPFWSPL